MSRSNHTRMNTQQAPPLRHASRVVPAQSASMKAQRIAGGTAM
jgi:hypothetical protein